MRFCLGLLICLIGNSLSDNSNVVLDLKPTEDHSKFLVVKKQYMGITYYTYSPLPGNEIYSIVYDGIVIYIRVLAHERIESVFVYYNEQNNIPIFVLKTSSPLKNLIPLSGISISDDCNKNCAKSLMKFLRHTFQDNEKLQNKLKDMDNDNEVEKTINTMAYRLFNAEKYVNASLSLKSISTTDQLQSRFLSTSIT